MLWPCGSEQGMARKGLADELHTRKRHDQAAVRAPSHAPHAATLENANGFTQRPQADLIFPEKPLFGPEYLAGADASARQIALDEIGEANRPLGLRLRGRACSPTRR